MLSPNDKPLVRIGTRKNNADESKAETEMCLKNSAATLRFAGYGGWARAGSLISVGSTGTHLATRPDIILDSQCPGL